MRSEKNQANMKDRQIVWNSLYNSQIDKVMPSNTTYSWCDAVFGLDLAFRLEKFPSLLEINPPTFTLMSRGDSATREDFFKRLSMGQFLVNENLRNLNGPDQVDYFYHAFGQIPHLFDEEYCELLRLIGSVYVALGDSNPIGREMIENIYFKFFDYGAMVSDGEVRAIGAGIISSEKEMIHFKSNKEKRIRDFNYKTLILGDRDSDDFQPVYHVFESFDQVSEFIITTASLALDFKNKEFTSWKEILETLG